MCDKDKDRNRSVSVYIMRCVEKKKIEEAEKTTRKAPKTLLFLIVADITLVAT
jgi:hypothetical protein